jgi:hypothetical protein
MIENLRAGLSKFSWIFFVKGLQIHEVVIRFVLRSNNSYFTSHRNRTS